MRKLIFFAVVILLSGCTVETSQRNINITYHFVSHSGPYAIAYTDDEKLVTGVEENLYATVGARARIGSDITARISNADTTFSIKVMVSHDNKVFAEQSGKGFVELKTTIPLDILER